MKKIVTIFLLILPVVAFARFEPVIKDIDEFFAGKSGYIIEVTSGEVYTDLTAADGAYPGKIYNVYRESEVIKHPITGEVLGKKKEKIGKIKIDKLFEKYSTADIVSREKPFKKADLVMVNPPFDVSVTFVNFGQRLQLLLKQEMSGAKNIRISENPEYGIKFSQDKQGGITADIYANQQEIRSFYYADIAATAESGKSSTVDLLRSSPIDAEYKSISVGNIYKDNFDYIVAAGDEQIDIYKFEAKGFARADEIKGDFDEIVSVEVADLNKNGHDEIYVSNISNTRSIKSMIFEYSAEEGRFKLLKSDIPFLFRTGLVNDEKKIFCQRVSYKGEYYGNIYEYAFDAGFHRGESIPNTSEFGVFGFGMGNIDGDEKLEQFYVDDDYNLEIYESGKKIYESNVRFGDTPNYFVISEEIKQKLSSEDYADKPFELAKYKNYLKGRVFVTKDKVLYMIKNKPFASFLPNFDKFTDSQFGGYKWEGNMLRRVWESDVFKPVIVDYYLQERFGKVYVFLLRTYSGGLFDGEKSELIYMEIK
ncbi:hypothetical protein Flexsi_0230 [Flexistipes sinusarabici DSM 4947]|uniref:VCBS repeat-containing protein n=1 Tax=Flexistipes sinusarabici (strain ATCC 49648 / DSM 4947 / MAS 10) TaxID=717231 RepID=F8E7S7_FLESM|nr:VCBS repeat-containing protein [Flexistipes sinusarabici]AEI13922.1 hypothetical protein Flexsi_0230 [Flexistipes sinusarabici DSM 4947]